LYAIPGDTEQKCQRIKIICAGISPNVGQSNKTNNKIPQWMRRSMTREYTKKREGEAGNVAEMVAMANSKREEEQKGKWAFGEVKRKERLLYHIVIRVQVEK
jgi:hypothetical protein